MNRIDIPSPELINDRMLAQLLTEAIVQRPVNPDLPFQASEFFAHMDLSLIHI